jgi:hypothetical protein
MQPGLELVLLASDPYAQAFEVSVSNESFFGRARIDLLFDETCGAPDGARLLVAGLEGFPASRTDRRTIRLGGVHASGSDGGLQLDLAMRQSTGPARAEVVLRSGHREPGQLVHLSFVFEVAALDDLVRQLRAMGQLPGTSAQLRAFVG